MIAGWWAYFYIKVDHCVVTLHSEALWYRYVGCFSVLCHCYETIFIVFVTSLCFSLPVCVWQAGCEA